MGRENLYLELNIVNVLNDLYRRDELFIQVTKDRLTDYKLEFHSGQSICTYFKVLFVGRKHVYLFIFNIIKKYIFLDRTVILGTTSSHLEAFRMCHVAISLCG